jgi:hypothetical protein
MGFSGFAPAKCLRVAPIITMIQSADNVLVMLAANQLEDPLSDSSESVLVEI